MAPLALKSTASVRPQVQRTRAVKCRADGAFLGSTTNLIMVTTTSLALASGRFGLAPTSTKNTDAGLKLVDNKTAGLLSNDPAGFNIVDVMAHGAVGHGLGVGIVLGLKGIGAL